MISRTSAIAQRGDAGEVLVAVGHELEQPGRDAGLHDADPGAVADRDQPVALGHELDQVARVDLGELGRAGEVREVGEAGLAGLLDEDADRRLRAGLRRDGLLAGLDEEDLEPVDVALGDPVRRVERERLLVVLARRAELAQLPQRLGQPVLGLGVRPQLEQPLVRLGGLGPVGGGRLRDRLLDQLALEAGLAGGRLGCGVDLGEGHGAVVLSGSGWTRRTGACRGHGKPRGVRSRARVSSIPGPVRQTADGPVRAVGPRGGRLRPAGAGSRHDDDAERGQQQRLPQEARLAPARRGAAVERVPQVEHQRQQRRPDEQRQVDRPDRAGRRPRRRSRTWRRTARRP